MADFPTDAPADALARSRLPLPRGTLLGFVVALVAVAVTAVVSVRALRQSAETADLVEHTYEVAIQVRNVLGAIKDAETGQRGFLLTGNVEYLDTQRQGNDALPGALDRLRSLMADNPAQIKRLDTLDRLVRDRVAEIDETLRLFREGRRDEALATVRSNRGKAKMDASRRVIGEIQQAESALLAERQQALACAN